MLMEQKKVHRSKFDDVIYLLTSLAIVAGIVLTIISALGLCTEECAEGHNYRIFGMKFEVVGLLFFGFLATVHILSRWYSRLIFIETLLFAGGLGAEVMFILFQKYWIGSWCPVCLGIASSVALGAGALFISYAKQLKNSITSSNKEEVMRSLTRGSIAGVVMFIGFFSSFMGITKLDAMAEAGATLEKSLEFGNKTSNIEVYLFTDWACPACQKLEGQLEPMANAIMKEATFIFVDHAIHPETLNFIPYHLSFIINDKPQYFKLRNMLTEISKKTGSPTEEEITEAAKKLGVTYKELNYADVALGIKYFKQLGKKFKIVGTPTLVILNKDTKKGKKLTGNDEITMNNTLKAIETLKSL